MENNYSHLVEIDEETRLLSIYRIFPNGKKHLFTSVEIPDRTFSENEKGFRLFAQTLGENLLIDSPITRKLFKI